MTVLCNRSGTVREPVLTALDLLQAPPVPTAPTAAGAARGVVASGAWVQCAALFVGMAGAAVAQNRLPDGEFEQGGAGWTRQFLPFVDGGSGFAAKRVAGNGPSSAAWSTMLPPVGPAMTVLGSHLVSAAFVLPAGQYGIGFRAMWENPAQLPLPAWNGVELRIVDAGNVVVWSRRVASPQPLAAVSRAQVADTLVVAGGTFHAELWLDNGIPAAGVAGHTVSADDLWIGAPVSFVFGQGCAGSGGGVPVLDTVLWPARGTNGFAVELHDALAPGLAVFGMDVRGVPSGMPPVPLGGGCMQLVGAGFVLVLPVSGQGAGAGVASAVLPIPNAVALAGLQCFCQWGVPDPAATSTVGVAVTAGVAFTVQ